MVKCYRHNVEYEEVETDYEYRGIVIRGVKALRCPIGGEEMFTLEQYGEIKRRVSDAMKLKPLRLHRKVSASGKRPAILLPEDIVRSTGIKVGDEIDIYQEGRRIVIEPAEEEAEV
jgi:hypothetical protein